MRRVNLENECRVLRQENADLSRQIQALLYSQQEESRSLPTGRASGVITDTLVPFSNICELQQRNIELLRVIRELSDDRESEESHQQTLLSISCKPFDSHVEQIQRSLEEKGERLRECEISNNRLEEKIRSLRNSHKSEIETYKQECEQLRSSVIYLRRTQTETYHKQEKDCRELRELVKSLNQTLTAKSDAATAAKYRVDVLFALLQRAKYDIILANSK